MDILLCYVNLKAVLSKTNVKNSHSIDKMCQLKVALNQTSSIWNLQGITCYNSVMTQKCFWNYWPFETGIHRSPTDSPQKGLTIWSFDVFGCYPEQAVQQTVVLPAIWDMRRHYNQFWSIDMFHIRRNLDRFTNYIEGMLSPTSNKDITHSNKLN